jgi:hypothetical protein
MGAAFHAAAPSARVPVALKLIFCRGGKPEDYPVHNWFAASKEFMCDFRHRALRHHAQGVFEAAVSSAPRS